VPGEQHLQRVPTPTPAARACTVTFPPQIPEEPEQKTGTQRYQLTPLGLKTALFYSRTYQRVIRPGLSLLEPAPPHDHARLTRAYRQFQTELSDYFAQQQAA